MPRLRLCATTVLVGFVATLAPVSAQERIRLSSLNDLTVTIPPKSYFREWTRDPDPELDLIAFRGDVLLDGRFCFSTTPVDDFPESYFYPRAADVARLPFIDGFEKPNALTGLPEALLSADHQKTLARRQKKGKAWEVCGQVTLRIGLFTPFVECDRAHYAIGAITVTRRPTNIRTSSKARWRLP